MNAAVIVLVVVGVVVVFAIAAGVVGREAHRLDAIAPRAVYIDHEAVDYVAACLSDDVQARVTPEELAELLRAHMHWLWEKGLQPDNAVDQRQSITERPVVMEDVTATGYLIGEADRLGIDVDDIAVAEILEAHLAYFEAIGAVGPTAEDPDVDPAALGRPPIAGELRRGNGDHPGLTPE